MSSDVQQPGSRKPKPTDWGSVVEREEAMIDHKMRMRLKRIAETEPHCKPGEKETDSEVLERRQKQIDYGRSTPEYVNYRKLVTIRGKYHPRTPDKTKKYSRRGWDTIIRIWRKQLHFWDPADQKNQDTKVMGDVLDELGNENLEESMEHDDDDIKFSNN